MARRDATRRLQSKGTALPKDADNIPLALPEFGLLPQGKTLLDTIDEKKGVRVVEVTGEQARALEASGVIKIPDLLPKTTSNDNDDDEEEDSLTPFGTACLYSSSLAAVYCTLKGIVMTQYQQDVSFQSIVGGLVRLWPALLLAIYILHQPIVKQFATARQLVFLATSIGSSCWLMFAGNEHGYYYVMKQAPPLGALWIWSVMEMDLMWICIHGLALLGYMWWHSYGAF